MSADIAFNPSDREFRRDPFAGYARGRPLRGGRHPTLSPFSRSRDEAVDEASRFSTRTQWVSRRVARETALCRERGELGAVIRSWVASASRDARADDQPRTLRASPALRSFNSIPVLRDGGVTT